MKCPSEIELNEFAEGRLDSRRRWEVQEHLTQCAGCRADLEGLQWAGDQLAVLEGEAEPVQHPSDDELAALAEGKVPADRKAELLSHLGSCVECAWLFGRLPRKQRTFALPRAWYGFAAAAALLIAVGLFAFGGLTGSHHRLPVPPAQQMAKVQPSQKPQGAALKATPAPVAVPASPLLAQAPKPAPTSKPVTASRAATPKLASHAIARTHPRRSLQPRRGRHQEDKMQIAMNIPAQVTKGLPETAAQITRGHVAEDKTFAVERTPQVAAVPVHPAPASRPMAAMGAPSGHGATHTEDAARTPGAPAQPAPAAATRTSDHTAGTVAAPTHPQTRRAQPVKKTPVGLNDPHEKTGAKVAQAQLPQQELTGLKQKVSKVSTGDSDGKARVKGSDQAGQHASGQHLAHHHQHHHRSAQPLADAHAHSHDSLAQPPPPGQMNA